MVIDFFQTKFLFGALFIHLLLYLFGQFAFFSILLKVFRHIFRLSKFDLICISYLTMLATSEMCCFLYLSLLRFFATDVSHFPKRITSKVFLPLFQAITNFPVKFHEQSAPRCQFKQFFGSNSYRSDVI